MADGIIEYDVVANTSKIKSSLSGIGSVAGGVVKSVAAVGAAIGSAAIGLVAASAKVGSEFEAQMSSVAAVAGFSVEELNKVGSETQIQFKMLEDAALEAGRTTVFTATQSAEALEYLQLAGYSVTESIETLPSVLNLAAAANIDLGYAANLVVDSAHALGIELDDLDDFLDQVTATAFNSNTSIEDLGEAFLVVGGTGRIAAGGTAELNQALGILADNGIKGSEGGTKLRNVLLSLSAPTDKAADQLDALGVSVADAEGNLLPLENIIGQLGESLEGLGNVEATDILNTIFNKRDIVAVQALLNATEDDWLKLANAIEDSSGATSQAAETLLDNLQGDLTLLRSQLEFTGIAVYQSFQEPLREAVQSATQFFDTISSDGTLDQFAAIIGDLGVALVSGLVDVLPVVLNLIESLLPVVQEAAEQIFPILVDVLYELIPIFAQLIGDLLPPLLDLFVGILPPLFELVEALLPPLIGLFESLIPVIVQIIEAVLPTLIQLLDTLLPPLIQLVDALLPPLIQLFDALWPIIETILFVLADLVELFLQALNPIIDLIVFGIEPLIDIFNFLVDIIASLVAPQLEFLMGVFDQVFKTIAESVREQLGAVIDVLKGLLDFIIAVFTGDWEAAWQAVQDIFGGIFRGLVSLVKTPLNAIIGLINSVIRGLNAISLPDWVPLIGGKSVNIPEIPQLRVGLDYVPYDEFPALLHEGEAVLTADEANVWRAMQKNLSNATLGLNASLGIINRVHQSSQSSPESLQLSSLNKTVERGFRMLNDKNNDINIQFTGDGAQLVRWLYPIIRTEANRIGSSI